MAFVSHELSGDPADVTVAISELSPSDTFRPVVAAPAINGQTTPTIGETLSPRNPLNRTVNGRALVASKGPAGRSICHTARP